MTTVKIVLVYHSGYGHTERLAQAVAKGAQAQRIAIDQDGNVSDADWASMDEADAIVMGSPTYMGGVSWQFKKFADASSKQWFARRWENKIAAGFTTSGSLSGDKLSTLQYLLILAMQHGMIWVGQATADEQKITDGLNRLGSYIGVMGHCGPLDPASALPQGDIETAIAYGERVAAMAAKLA